jgi:hypothetical protein
MLVVGTILSQSVTVIGLAAGAIAVGGFLGHARPALAGKHEEALRRATVIGGLTGIAGACLIIVLSAFVR